MNQGQHTSHGLTERGCCRFSGYTTTAYSLRVPMITDKHRTYIRVNPCSSVANLGGFA